MLKTKSLDNSRRQLAIEAAKEAGRILRSNFGKAFHVKVKSDRNLVTDIDFKADEIITYKIRKYFETDNIISEESPPSTLNSDYTWIIDPLDGTHNYIHNIDIFGVSIAVAYKEEGIIGVIYMPSTNELYTAQKGKGAFLNGRKIHVSDRNIKNATLIYDSTMRINKDKMFKSLGSLTDKVFNIRMLGSTVRGLSYIAEGKAEIEVEFNDKVWDYAAGLLIVEEAGGLSTDFEGNKWNIKTKGYVASNKKVHQQVIKMVGV